MQVYASLKTQNLMIFHGSYSSKIHFLRSEISSVNVEIYRPNFQRVRPIRQSVNPTMQFRNKISVLHVKYYKFAFRLAVIENISKSSSQPIKLPMQIFFSENAFILAVTPSTQLGGTCNTEECQER
jgi:hypothetical protein